MPTCGYVHSGCSSAARAFQSPNDLIAAIDRVMTMLQSGSTELLTALRFDEAREILEQRAQDLVAIVRREIADYRAGLQPGSQASGLPWANYESRAEALRRGAAQRGRSAENCWTLTLHSSSSCLPAKRASS